MRTTASRVAQGIETVSLMARATGDAVHDPAAPDPDPRRSDAVNYPKPSKCRYCGEVLSANEARYGRVCSGDECQREDAERERDMAAAAEEAAREDGYARYQ